jgi:hypothetical protein
MPRGRSGIQHLGKIAALAGSIGRSAPRRSSSTAAAARPAAATACLFTVAMQHLQ